MMESGDAAKVMSPQLLEKVARLELRARTVVEGLLSGMHRSTARGINVEFIEHRQYYPGDDLRHVDWKAYARTGRFVIKQHEEEKNLQVGIVLDASASMRYGADGAGDGKWEHAGLIAAALAYLFLKQGDAVGLTLAGAGRNAYVEPRSSRDHLIRILTAIQGAAEPGEAKLPNAIARTASQLKKRSFIIVVSDLLEAPEAVRDSLRALRGRGSDAVVFHVLSEAELSFPFTRASKFIDPETGGNLTTDPTAIKNRYLRELKMFTDAYIDFCMRAGIDFVPAGVGSHVEQILLGYLEKRERRKHR